MKLKNRTKSITEAYKLSLKMYLDELDNPDIYRKIVSNMLEYFGEWYKNTFIGKGYSENIDIIIKAFVPLDYFPRMNMPQKQIILRKIIVGSVRRMVVKIIEEYLNLIIDNHKENDNLNILRDDFINCFIIERESVYKMFILSETNRGNINDAKVNVMIMNDVKKNIKNLVDEKYALLKQIEELKNVRQVCMKKLRENKDSIFELKNEIINLKKRNQLLQDRINDMKEYEAEYNSNRGNEQFNRVGVRNDNINIFQEYDRREEERARERDHSSRLKKHKESGVFEARNEQENNGYAGRGFLSNFEDNNFKKNNSVVFISKTEKEVYPVDEKKGRVSNTPEKRTVGAGLISSVNTNSYADSPRNYDRDFLSERDKIDYDNEEEDGGINSPQYVKSDKMYDEYDFVKSKKNNVAGNSKKNK